MAAPDAAGPAGPKKAPMSSLMAVVDNGYAFLKKKIILYRLNSYFMLVFFCGNGDFEKLNIVGKLN